MAHEALHRALITFGSREIHSATFRRSAINPFAESGNDAGLFLMGRASNMINKLLGAAAMAAVILAVAPASAANMGGCSGANLTKTESSIDAMADGPERVMGQKEIALAQTAMLDGKMGACAMHLSKAMHVGAMNQASR
jgi:hypothetical protein